jgi:prepilin-type processing-associated H-X9-DG protein
MYLPREFWPKAILTQTRVDASKKHWPEDLAFEEAVELLVSPPSDGYYTHYFDKGFYYKPAQGINVAFADGSVKTLALPLSREHAEALLTINGGEDVDPEDIQPELDYARIYALSVFVLVSLLPAVKFWPRRKAAPLGEPQSREGTKADLEVK